MLPGWPAQVNGISIVPEMWNGLFTCIPPSAGNRQIHFIAPGATLGWIATALELALLWLGFRQTEGPKAL
ncbi:hypothetical protein BAR24_08730 [Gluconobacter oxydans]|nr:hypothetical protein B932_3531 [Gluconobacter oxydans H24]ANQ41540.1 hypothetical protein BAR24_08730 [Gluconobacter oxydans]